MQEWCLELLLGVGPRDSTIVYTQCVLCSSYVSDEHLLINRLNVCVTDCRSGGAPGEERREEVLQLCLGAILRRSTQLPGLAGPGTPSGPL